ncbi:hypothetical protein bwei_1897 [Bacillus mycoides]|nr:hypothetical protein bwei_1897 [Bacillus mycoides]EEL05505.1 hypothetical protein bcere0014_29130 [Bacillus cereus BDRD-ST196]
MKGGKYIRRPIPIMQSKDFFMGVSSFINLHFQYRKNFL